MQEFKYIRNMWYPVAFSHEVAANQLLSIKLSDIPLVVWRDKGTGAVVAFDDRCCHKRFPMSDGKLMGDGSIRCAYHGLRYDLTGRCVEIPAQPNRPIPENARLRRLPIKENEGLIWIWPGDPDQSENLQVPPTPEIVDQTKDVAFSVNPIIVEANYVLLIENLLDTTHFYPLHDGNIGDQSNSEIEVNYDEGQQPYTPQYVKTIRDVKSYTLPPYFQRWFQYEIVDRIHTHCMETPGMTRVQFRIAPPGKLGTSMEKGYTLLHLHYPIDHRTLAWRWCVSTGKQPSGSDVSNVAAAMAEDLPTVIAQDEWVLPRQQKMYELPEDNYSELFIKTDRAVRRARQLLLRLQREEVSSPS